MPDRVPAPAAFPADVMVEELAPDWGFHVRSVRELERFRSPFQAVEVHDTASFGRLFRLDGHFMTSERDEFFYHENLVHMAALTHPLPRQALIVGGGDGGPPRGVKHPSVQAVTVCELDLAVVDIARKHLASVHRGALDDPRVTLRIADGAAFVRAATGFDLIVLDLPTRRRRSAVPPVHAPALAARKGMALHIASPIAHPDRIRQTLVSLRSAFSIVTPYLTSVPLYGGLWMMACCSATLDPRKLSAPEIDRRIAQRGITDLQYYNGEMHRAALAMPNFVRALVG
jgi:spermidine synthase